MQAKEARGGEGVPTRGYMVKGGPFHGGDSFIGFIGGNQDLASKRIFKDLNVNL